MSDIIELVESAFKAKRQYGPNSEEYKAFQFAVCGAIDKNYQYGDEQIIEVRESEVLQGKQSVNPVKIGIKIQKKKIDPGNQNPADYCSYALVRII